MLAAETTTTAPLLFAYQGISATETAELQSRPVEAECLFLPVGMAAWKPEEAQQAGCVLLQVVGEFVLELTADREQVLSAFRCDYEVQFQILRKASPIPSKLGEADGIRFLFREEGGRSVELAVCPDWRKKLQMFGKILGKKYIVQLGFHTSFKAIKKIGRGMTACVYNAINFANGREVAIKSFKRSVYFAQDNNNGKISFQKEFRILTQVNHKNLSQIYSVFETENSTYVILELYPLSLYGYLQKFGFPAEDLAKAIMVNLLEGIAYLHEKGIMHRDLKLQNIMVKKDDGKNGLIIPVIVDLGLAEYTNSEKYLYTRCGTPGYVAPEVLKIKSADPIQTYSCACDIFSLGVIFHILLFRKPLFEGKDVKEVIKKNCECDLNFDNQNFKTLPNDARDLFQRMLTKDPTQRITARDALSHPYLSSQKLTVYAEELEAQNIYQTQYSIHE